MNLKKKIGFIGLGCDKNRVDLERMMASIHECSFEISNNPEDCDIIVINTCAFIKSARDESEETIEEFLKLKKMLNMHDPVIRKSYYYCLALVYLKNNSKQKCLEILRDNLDDLKLIFFTAFKLS